MQKSKNPLIVKHFYNKRLKIIDLRGTKLPSTFYALNPILD